MHVLVPRVLASLDCTVHMSSLADVNEACLAWLIAARGCGRKGAWHFLGIGKIYNRYPDSDTLVPIPADSDTRFQNRYTSNIHNHLISVKKNCHASAFIATLSLCFPWIYVKF